jgi:hypothetical protein
MESTPQAPAKQPRSRKPRTKPVRTIGVAVRPSDVNPYFVIRITEGKKTDLYSVRPIPSDWGKAYAMAKLPEEQDPYHVCLAGADSVCDCKGFLRHGHCRHVEGLTALTNAGRL